MEFMKIISMSVINYKTNTPYFAGAIKLSGKTDKNIVTFFEGLIGSCPKVETSDISYLINDPLTEGMAQTFLDQSGVRYLPNDIPNMSQQDFDKFVKQGAIPF